MLKIDKTGVSTSKRVYFRMFLPSLASVMAARPCHCSFLLFVVEVPANFVETAKRAITCSVPRHKIWQNFWTCQSCKIGWYCCTRACRYITPRALCMTSLSCGEAGIEYIATSWVQSTGISNWWCCNGPVAPSSFADWATMRSCFLPSREPASSTNCWNRASSRARKPVLKNAPWNWSNPRFHTSIKKAPLF